MVLAVIIGLVIICVIVMLAEDSSKETTKEKYGDAVSQLASKAADGVSCVAYQITTPRKTKEYNNALETLSKRNTRLLLFTSHEDVDALNRLFDVDNELKFALKVLGLPETQWRELAQNLYYIGVIRRESRDPMDFTRKKEKFIREHMINEWPLKGGYLLIAVDRLKEALNYFSIPISEWIEYGDVVLEMHNVLDNPLIEKYGIRAPIKGMPNNLHKL